MNAAWVTAAIALACALAGLLLWAGRIAWRLISRTMQFLDDWAGAPVRPGVPARPGVMESIGALRRQVAEIKAETRPNGGHSLRDVVHKIREDVSDMKADQAAMRARVELFEHEREERDR